MLYGRWVSKDKSEHLMALNHESATVMSDEKVWISNEENILEREDQLIQ